jgi:RNA polymerase sigma factor (sigma-70 family)
MAIAPRIEQHLDEAVRLVEADLRRYCHRLTRDEHEAADLAQEALLRSIPRLREGDLEPAEAGAYVRTVARNLLISDRRRRRPAPSGTLADIALVSPDLEPPQAVILADQRRRVRTARARLAPRQRAALQLRDVEGRPYDEIGAHVGLNENGVAQLLNRARRRLRSEVRLAHVDTDRLPPACRARVPSLVAEAEGQLSGPEHDDLHRHLERCPFCQAALAAARAASERVRVLGPAGLLAAVRRFATGGFGGGGTVAAVVGGSALLAGGVVVAHHSAAAATGATARPPAIVRAAAMPTGRARTAAARTAGGGRAATARHGDQGRTAHAPPGHAGRTRAGTKGAGGGTPGGALGASANAPAAGSGAGPAAGGDGTPAKTTIAAPRVSRPTLSTAAVSTPQVSTPGVTTRGVSTPAVTTPVATVPSATAPSVTVPSVTVPGVTVPTVTVTVPTVTLPTVTVPHLP